MRSPRRIWISAPGAARLLRLCSTPERGIFVAKAVRAQLETVLTHFPPVRIDMTEEERYNAALALTSALPERAFTGEYDRLFGPDESEKENVS